MPYTISIFEWELSLISDSKLRKFVKDFLETIVPAYFWIIAASSSGKYHPEFALGIGGLVRHTKAAVRIAYELFTINNFTQIEKDRIIASLLLHDTFKQGVDGCGNTVHEHPLIAAERVRSCNLELDNDTRETIASCIASHMGQWTQSKYSDVILPKPRKKLEKFVHSCDYLASRKSLEIKF